MTSVLVVDDVPDNLKLLSYELADHGYHVRTASDGMQALALVQAERPDVILLDIMMPGLDGIEVCRRLKADPQLRPIPVIMISARELDDDVVLGLDAGAQDYVTKPFNLQIAMARVRSAARAKADHDLIVELNERLAAIAHEDGLTGLKNRRSFQEALAASFALAVRQGIPLSLLMLDVDDFKRYNDTFGHMAGDEVLYAVGQLLRRGSRSEDIVARYGGEEFVMVLPATEAEPARTLAERLRGTIADHAWPLRRITASFGIATLIRGETDPLALVREADRALYRSKEQGRDRVTHSFDLAKTGPNRSPARAEASEADRADARLDRPPPVPTLGPERPAPELRGHVSPAGGGGPA
ncbi:MAG: diguanylate cyclase [Planctomycetaceae bacterium]